MSRFAPARTSSPPKPSPTRDVLARNLLDDSRSSAQSIPELISLTPGEIEFIDAVIERASPTATTFLTVFKAYNDLLQERGVDPQQEVLYYGKLLKLGNVKGKNWGEKWNAIKDQQLSYTPLKSLKSPARFVLGVQSRSQALAKLTNVLKTIEREDDALTLHSYQNEPELVKAAPVLNLEPTNGLSHSRTPRFHRRPSSPSPIPNSLRLYTGPASTSRDSTPRPALQLPVKRELTRTPVAHIWDAESSIHTVESTPASAIPPSYKSATRDTDALQHSSYTPLRALAKAHLNSKEGPKEDSTALLVSRHASALAREVVLKARETRGTVLNEDDAWNKVRIVQDEKTADRFREDKLVERCWEVWKQGHQWITTTHDQIAHARDNLILRFAMHKWRARVAARCALYQRIAALSDNRRLRVSISVWKARAREKRQMRWRTDMRSKMKIIRDKHEKNLARDVWEKWTQAYSSRIADQHLSTSLTFRFFRRWRVKLTALDQLGAACDHFVTVGENEKLGRVWRLWRHLLILRETEKLISGKIALRVLSAHMKTWKKRINYNQVADQHYDHTLLKRCLTRWKTSKARIRLLERRADKHIARQNDVLVRAIVRVWKAHERGKLLERVMAVRLLKQAWAIWRRRRQHQRELEALAQTFSTRPSSVLASSSLQRWRQVLLTHHNARVFALKYYSARLQFTALVAWRLQLRKKMRAMKQAKVAEKIFIMRKAWQSWANKLAEKRRERKVKEFAVRVVRSYFENWKTRAKCQRELRQVEEIVRQKVAARIMSSTLAHWTTRVADLKFRELETSQRHEQWMMCAAFKKWKALCIRHVEELSLMESYQDVKREEHMRRMFYKWLSSARISRHRRIGLQEREEQMKQSKMISTWDKWREKFQHTRLQPLADILNSQRQRNVVFRAFGIWHSKSRSLPAVRFYASHMKARVWKTWRDAMPKAQQSKEAREMDRSVVLSKTFDRWVRAYKAKIALKAVARARYLRLPTAAPRQATQPTRSFQPPVASSSSAFPRTAIKPGASDEEDVGVPTKRLFRAKPGIASLLTTKPRASSPVRPGQDTPARPKARAALTPGSVSTRRGVSPTRSVASAASAVTRRTEPLPHRETTSTPVEARRSALWLELREVQLKARPSATRSKSREPP